MPKKQIEVVAKNNSKIISKNILRYLIAVIGGFVAFYLFYYLLTMMIPWSGCVSKPGLECIMMYNGEFEKYFLSHDLTAVILGIITFVALVPKQHKTAKVIWWGLIVCLLVFYGYLWTDTSHIYLQSYIYSHIW